MWDIAYFFITLLFFAAMLWYVQGCERLGGTNDADELADGRSSSSRRRSDGGN